MDQIPAWAMEKALALDLRWNNDTEWFQIIARALVAERERAAKIASDIFPDGKRKSQNAAYCAGNIIAAAIRNEE